MKDKISAVGLVSIYKNGVLTQQNNLVLALGKEWIAARCVGVTSDVVTHIAVGSGSTPAAPEQVGLVSEIVRVPLSEPASVGAPPEASTMQFKASFVEGVGDGALSEAGLFTAAVGGTCIARTVFPVKNKGPDDIFTIVWSITIS